MPFTRQIVVGVKMPESVPWNASSLSTAVRQAVSNAIDTARASRVPIALVAVLPATDPSWFDSQEEAEKKLADDRSSALDVLTDLKLEHSLPDGHSDVCIQLEVLVGEPWEQLTRFAGNRPDSLLVCGTREPTPFRRMLFGSTALKLLRLSPADVWIVKPRIDEPEFTDIVAATDAGPAGADVLFTAVSVARLLQARLHVVHAVHPSHPSKDVLTRAETTVHEQLGATDYRTLPYGVRVSVTWGAADECILRTAQENNADLVILGTSSKTGFSSLLPGSTIERLLPELSCSVLAIKPEGFRCLLPSDFWTVPNMVEVQQERLTKHG